MLCRNLAVDLDSALPCSRLDVETQTTPPHE
jgi:hypothetical protein